VLGIGRDDLTEEARNAVTAAHPRPDFKRRILQAFTDGNVHRPVARSGTSTPTCWRTTTRRSSATTSSTSS